MILIIDIDETCIHSHKDYSKGELKKKCNLNDSDSFEIEGYCVQKRPYLDMFIEKICNDDYYEVGVWSAGSKSYVHDIVHKIFPDKSKLKFILTRNDCNELYDKPLSKVRDLISKMDSKDSIAKRKTSNFLIIDDRDGVTGHDELNHLQIYPFEGDTNDDELERLWKFLDKYRYYSSEYLSTHWK